MWEKYIIDTFAKRQRKKSEYLLYRSEQLVGTALIIVVKSELSHHIRRVECATKKVSFLAFLIVFKLIKIDRFARLERKQRWCWYTPRFV